FNDPAGLLQRTREFSAALEGLRRRLERPAASLQVLDWRLRGPIGPLALAEGIVRDVRDGHIPGEPAFLLAELVLTLGRIRWDEALDSIEEKAEARNFVRSVIDDLKRMKLPS